MSDVSSSDMVVQSPAPATVSDVVVRVLSASRVAPSQPQGGRVKLNFLDVMWLRQPAVQQLFLYDRADDGVVSRLKTALADTLTHYLPWAGRLEYQPETGNIAIHYCSDADAGVAFVEAEADGMDVRRLAYDEPHDMPAFVSLVPELDVRVLPAAVLSVQVTRLGAGGLAVGLSMHHAVADGRGMWRFMEAWASTSRDGGGSNLGMDPPIYCRDAVHYPRADELTRERLKIIAPNLPLVCSGDVTSPLLRLARWTFHLGADDIRCLKRRIDHLAGAGSSPKPFSTFVALAALAWTAFVRSKGFGAADETCLLFLADMRARLDPPVPNAYLGNCLRGFTARSAEIAGEAGILHAARAVQALLAEMEAAPLRDDTVKKQRLPSSRQAIVAGSPWFKAYEVADFGFGTPALSEVVSMSHDGEMMLLGGRLEGQVQVSVSIHPPHMATYKAFILDCLDHALCDAASKKILGES